MRTYSGGMRRRLDLAAALVARPPILFLDEPTTGLDIRSRIALWESIEALVAGGTTVLLTTQYLEEADRLADRIVVINHGVVIAEGTSAAPQGAGGRRPARGAPHPRGRLGRSGRGPGADRRRRAGRSRRNGVDPDRGRGGAVTEAVRRLDEAGIAIDDIATQRPTLDDVFLQLTGQTAAEAEEESR